MGDDPQEGDGARAFTLSAGGVSARDEHLDNWTGWQTQVKTLLE